MDKAFVFGFTLLLVLFGAAYTTVLAWLFKDALYAWFSGLCIGYLIALVAVYKLNE